MGKTVITYGTFDLFHIGHLNIIKRLREHGDRLIVGVSTDEFNAIKGKKPIVPFEQRMEIVESLKYVDLAIPEDRWSQQVRGRLPGRYQVSIRTGPGGPVELRHSPRSYRPSERGIGVQAASGGRAGREGPAWVAPNGQARTLTQAREP